MKIAVTGGSGFLGAATIAWAQSVGLEAWSFDRTNGDDVLDNLKGLKGANVVIHLAGILGTDELFDKPEDAVQSNVVGTLRVLEWCRNNDAGYVGITMPDSSWANVYQATKLCAKRLATAWHETYGVDVSHVRAFNVYGPGQKHGPGHPQKFLPTWAMQGWNRQPFTVWGSGFQTVDSVYVDDVARMLVDACRYGGDQTFDAGTSTPVTVNEFVTFVSRYTQNEKAGVLHLPMRRGERPDTVIVAQGEGWDVLNWRPYFNWGRVAETIEWYKVKT